MRIKPGFVLRKIVDEYMIIPTGERLADFNGIISLNETAAFVWKKLENGATADDLLGNMTDEFDAPRETIQSDLKSILAELDEYGVLEHAE